MIHNTHSDKEKKHCNEETTPVPYYRHLLAKWDTVGPPSSRLERFSVCYDDWCIYAIPNDMPISIPDLGGSVMGSSALPCPLLNSTSYLSLHKKMLNLQIHTFENPSLWSLILILKQIPSRDHGPDLRKIH